MEKREMTGKEFLYSLKNVNAEINKSLEKLETLKAAVTSTTASTDKESIQGNGDQDKLGAMMAKIIDLEREINLFTDDLADRRTMAKDIIFSIRNENQQNMLYDFFICYIPLSQIAENYDLTYKASEKLKARAIKEFEKRYNTYNN